MSQARSPATGRAYGVRRVCRVWGVARSTFYEQKAAASGWSRPSRHLAVHPPPWLSDGELLAAIRTVIAETERDLEFYGEGYRKVWARLRARGVRSSKRRVLRVMRENGLLAPTRRGPARGPRNHDGTIVTEEPDVMWGTDATAAWTRDDGLVTVFVVVDHCASELVGVHAAKKATRFEALEAMSQAVGHAYGQVDRGAAEGLKIRHDHGSQFTSRAYQQALAFWGMESSPSFVRSPEGNGVAERFIRTLKEQLLWVQDFTSAEHLRQALQAFRLRYNQEWLLGRHGYASPSSVRESHRSTELKAA